MDSRELPQYLEAVREALTLWKQMERLESAGPFPPGSVGELRLEVLRDRFETARRARPIQKQINRWDGIRRKEASEAWWFSLENLA